MWQAIKNKARQLKGELAALWFCSRHPRTPWYAKVLVVALVTYAFSPIDLIPDFIPVLGYLDEIVLLPMGIWLVLKLVPDDVLAECQASAKQWLAESGSKPRSYIGAAVIIGLWIFAAWATWRWLVPLAY